MKLEEAVIRLKEIPRRGWLRCGVQAPESVAAHTTGTALLAMALAAWKGLDAEKAAAMAVLHDLAEAITGDITPADSIPLDVRRGMEDRAMEEICYGVPSGERMLELWKEFASGDSETARVVRQADVLDRLLQARHYAAIGYSTDEFMRDLDMLDPEIRERFF